MARKQRIHFPGAFYHVILRGNYRQDIFFNAADRLLWEASLRAALNRYQASVHCYCWMTNHVHMLVQVDEKPLGYTICYAASKYSRRINRQHQRSGHLFERRHRAYLVRDDPYLKGLIRYIHNNPLRAGLVKQVDDYQWSSHAIYAGLAPAGWITTQFVQRSFGPTLKAARRRYLAFMQDDGEADLARYRSETGADEILIEAKTLPYKPAAESSTKGGNMSLEAIIQHHLQVNKLKESVLTGPGRTQKLARIRTDIAIDALNHGAANTAQLARRLNRTDSAICQAVTKRRKLSK